VLVAALAACGDDAGNTVDAGTQDDAAAPSDGAAVDAAVADGALPDAAVVDGAVPDAAVPDAAVPDAAVPDAAVPDAAVPDAAVPDAMVLDAGPLANGVTTLAGSGVAGSADGFRTAAEFSNPANVAVAADGTVYVADFDTGLIRAVTAFGDVTTLTNQVGFARPFGLAMSSTGVLYVQTDRNSSETSGGALWSINTTTGVATVLFDNIGRPRGLAELADGRLVMAFYQDHVVKVYNPSTPATPPVVIAGSVGVADMVNGTGAAARFNTPYDVAAVSATEVVVADRANHRLRLVNVSTGVVSTYAGDGTAATTDGAALSAQFNEPQGLAVDNAGVVYVSELGGYVLRSIAGGTVATIAGDGIAGHVDSTTPLTARFWGLEGIAVRADGTLLYVADGSRGEADPYNRVRRVTLP